jgi:hypothetical protein
MQIKRGILHIIAYLEKTLFQMTFIILSKIFFATLESLFSLKALLDIFLYNMLMLHDLRFQDYFCFKLYLNT